MRQCVWGDMMMNHNYYGESWSAVEGNKMKNEGKWRLK